ncbi:hypothetical protein SAMN06295879_3467 [Agreia bicolorata]|uniref:Uncharacterized protein n=1 Tax=Agreia bicolorata TaxID=110935 RepID=A0A1T4YLM9_9MICO|nr:hypothetical protein [Agreia bicolorata]SKB02175.1 hypothetical protein SAMN06295879_3467 [Agreia bicolorata]
MMGRGERSDNTWGRAANTLNVEDIETVGDISNEADTLDRLEKSGAPNTTSAYSILLASGQAGSGTLVMDESGHASAPIPADDGVASVSVFYVVGDRVGPTRTIVPSFR